MSDRHFGNISSERCSAPYCVQEQHGLHVPTGTEAKIYGCASKWAWPTANLH